MSALLSNRAKALKHAVVVSKQQHEDLDFVETVVVNRGARMRLFDSVVNAAAWLNE